MKNTLVYAILFLVSSLAVSASAGSLACDFDPAKGFSYSGTSSRVIGKGVKGLTADCAQIANSSSAHDEWQRSFLEKCSSLCYDRLGKNSLDGSRCRQACGMAAIKSAETSRAYFRGVQEGKNSCGATSPDHDSSNSAN